MKYERHPSGTGDQRRGPRAARVYFSIFCFAFIVKSSILYTPASVTPCHRAGKGGSQSARGASKAERATWACQSARTAAELRAAIEGASKVEGSTIDLEHELDQAIERLSKLVAEE